MNEQNNIQPEESVQNSKNIWTIVITVIITALIVGGGVYVWQWAVAKSAEQNLQKQITNLQIKFSQSQQQSLSEQNDVEKKQNWYSDIIDKITKTDRANTYDNKCTQYTKDGIALPAPLKVDCVEGKILEKDISELRYFQNKNVVIALIPGIYGGSGFKLIKYNIENGNVEIAKREDVHGGKESNWFKIHDERMNVAPEQKKDKYLWFGTPDRIISYDNNKMILTGLTGDAECWAKSYYECDIEKNYISITELCSGCGTEKEECTKY